MVYNIPMIEKLVLINGEWYVLEEIDGDIVWVSNKDGAEFEFPLSEVEAMNDDCLDSILEDLVAKGEN